MNGMKKNMKKIYENVTIYFKNGERECYKAITFRKKGICTGIIKNNPDSEIRFIEQGYIPLNRIEKITYLLENDETRIVDFFNKIREE
jgi:hypothetical protein